MKAETRGMSTYEDIHPESARKVNKEQEDKMKNSVTSNTLQQDVMASDVL